MRQFPVLWLCGPSGVGKTSTGYELFAQLVEAGVAAAYVDLDQVGLCYPAPGDDPNNDRLKARNLGEVYAGFRAAGAQCLVISGLVGDAREVRRHADLLPGAALTVCRLRVGHDGLRDRIARRGWLLHLTEDAIRNADDLDLSDFADLVVDTGELAVSNVAARIRTTGWPGQMAEPETFARPAPVDTDTDTVPVLWMCGPPGVGKSTIGYEIFQRVVGGGVKAAYVDLAQIGFCRPAPGDDRRAALLARLWERFRAAGARCLIISGGVADQGTADRYTGAIPSGEWTVCRLRGGRETLAERIGLRGRGVGPPLAGEGLRGRPAAYLRRCVDDAVRIAGALELAGVGDLVLDTDGRTVADLADQVIAGTPGRAVALGFDSGRRAVS